MSLLGLISRTVLQSLGPGLSQRSSLNAHRWKPIVQALVQARTSSKLVLPFKLDDGFHAKETRVPEDFRHVYPEFLPDPKPEWRNRLREKLEREDMLSRRTAIDLPEFYPGSVLAATVSDPNASGKTNRFVGICLSRGGTGLRAWFILRNVVDNIGVEILYELYCPLLLGVEVLRLERRLDADLTYLRDCLPRFSTFPFDMEPEPLPDGAPVPTNTLKAKLKPRPWHERWERKDLKGVEDVRLPIKFGVRAKRHETPWEKYDLMKEYRATIPEEEQAKIYSELTAHMPQLEAVRRRIKRVRMQKERKF